MPDVPSSYIRIQHTWSDVTKTSQARQYLLHQNDVILERENKAEEKMGTRCQLNFKYSLIL